MTALSLYFAQKYEESIYYFSRTNDTEDAILKKDKETSYESQNSS